jgi:hypothetical protein
MPIAKAPGRMVRAVALSRGDNMRLRTFAFASIVVVGIGTASAVTPAQATEEPRQAQAAEKPRHCVTNLSQPKAQTVCYSSFTKAIAKATGGRITDAPNDTRIAMRDRRLQARLRATGTNKRVAIANAPAEGPIAIFFKGYDFTGQSWIFLGKKDCTKSIGNTDYKIEAMIPPEAPAGWNNRIRSYITYRRCWVKLYEHAGYSGASLDYDGDRGNLGLLDGNVSSIKLS